MPKNYFRTIKILFFFPDFPRLQGWGGSDQIWRIPDFFLTLQLAYQETEINEETDSDKEFSS